MRKKHFILLLVFLGFGCYPNGPDFVQELDAVYTNYDPEYSFEAQTYLLPPGVLDVTSESPGGTPEYIDPAYGDPILNGIRDNLNARGWTEVTEADNPDLIILASAFRTTTYFYYDWGWWGGWYPGWGPGWGWWYPGYRPVYVSGYSTGTVVMQMTNPNDIQDDLVPVVWVGSMNGLLQGSSANIISRIETNVDQAFNQAPFN